MTFLRVFEYFIFLSFIRNLFIQTVLYIYIYTYSTYIYFPYSEGHIQRDPCRGFAFWPKCHVLSFRVINFEVLLASDADVSVTNALKCCSRTHISVSVFLFFSLFLYVDVVVFIFQLDMTSGLRTVCIYVSHHFPWLIWAAKRQRNISHTYCVLINIFRLIFRLPRSSGDSTLFVFIGSIIWFPLSAG